MHANINELLIIHKSTLLFRASSTLLLSVILLDRALDLVIGSDCILAAASMGIHMVSVHIVGLLCGADGSILMEL